MKKFQKLEGKCLLGVSIVVDKRNAPHILELINKVKDTGANSVNISPCIISRDALENNGYHGALMEKVKEQVAEAKSKLADESFQIYDAYHELEDKFQKDYTWCPYIQILPVIGADLNVYSCKDKAYNWKEGKVGSIKEIPFKVFWYNNKDKFFNINPSRVCNHHCIANEKNKMIHEYLECKNDHLGFV